MKRCFDGVGDDSIFATVRAILPHSLQLDGERVICYPGDEHHPVEERAMPRPTRLRYRNKLFEPLDGFEALFG